MPKRNVNSQAANEDFYGNNAAFCCPLCSKVFIVSAHLNKKNGRACPSCGRSTGRVNGDNATIEWLD